ncbi:MAG: (2Fe-2S)-binding protein [Reichenbachiella sp.]
MPSFKLKVNGEEKTVDNIESDMPILWVLRDILQMSGTKFGCGKGQCGACTVHLNGVAIRSCSAPISSAVGQEITTIEGLSTDGSHPLQKTWVEENVPQCGYCQSGQIMNAASLLAGSPNPSDDEIKDSMNGNICRCGTYNRIHKAIKRAVKEGGTV